MESTRTKKQTAPVVVRRRRAVAILAAVSVAAALTAGLVALSQGSAEAASGPPDQRRAVAARLLTGTADWRRVRQVVAHLKAYPPATPLVVMFGTSTVRESTVNDRGWSRLLGRKAGVRVLAYNLGSSNQTFTHNIKLVEHLPAVPTVVFIGIDVVRFVPAPADPMVTLPAPEPIPASYDQHRYSRRRILSATRKRALVRDWVKRRYRIFRSNYAHNLGELRRLIELCLAGGMHPVLLESPRNTAVIKSAFNKAVRRYRASCRGLAARYGIPYVDFLAKARFKNRDFYDIWHAVEPGRAKWQPLLSAHAVRLLRRYCMVPAAP